MDASQQWQAVPQRRAGGGAGAGRVEWATVGGTGAGGGDALEELLQQRRAPPLAARARSVPDASLMQSVDHPLLAVESAFIFPAGMQLVRDSSDSIMGLPLGTGRVSDSMAALWARPQQQRHSTSAPGILSEAMATAAAAARQLPGSLSTVLPFGEDALMEGRKVGELEGPELGTGAAAALESDILDAVFAAAVPPAGGAAAGGGTMAASGAAAAGAAARSAPSGGFGGSAAGSALGAAGSGQQWLTSTPLDLSALAHKNADKLRLLSSIGLEEEADAGEGVAALDAFLKRFVAEQVG